MKDCCKKFHETEFDDRGDFVNRTCDCSCHSPKQEPVVGGKCKDFYPVKTMKIIENCASTSPKTELWVEEFDKKFPIIEITGENEAGGIFVLEQDKQKVKDFISSLLSASKANLIEEKVKKIEEFITPFESRFIAKDLVITILKEDNH